MRVIKLFLITFTLTFISFSTAGCWYEEPVESNRPRFEVIITYDRFGEYIDKSKDYKGDMDILYKETIYDPIYKAFISGGEYSNLAKGYIGGTIREIDDMEYKLKLLKKEKVEEIVEEALRKSNDLLNGVDTTVYIFPNTSEYSYLTKDLGGVVGVTAGSGKILLLVDPLNEQWKNVLSYTVAHEYHHSVWTSRKYEFEGNILANLVFEGKADSFANKVFPDLEVPWVSSIEPGKEKAVWNSIKNQLSSDDSELFQKLMFGGGDFQRWSGYTIGYHIVQDFLKNNSDYSIEEWTKLSSTELLNKSGYK